MKIPNYDVKDDFSSNYKQKVSFMPDRCFRMLVCAPSGGGKTNVLLDMIYRLLYFDEIYLYAKNLEQLKYQYLLKIFEPINEEAGYNIIETSNHEIRPVSELTDDNQKLIIFDDFVCEKNQKPLVDYFIRGRHKNCSIVYLSQSYYKTPKDIRLNCSRFCIYEFPSNNEISMICRENNIDKENIKGQLKIHTPFCILISRGNSMLKTLMKIYNLIKLYNELLKRIIIRSIISNSK